MPSSYSLFLRHNTILYRSQQGAPTMGHKMVQRYAYLSEAGIVARMNKAKE